MYLNTPAATKMLSRMVSVMIMFSVLFLILQILRAEIFVLHPNAVAYVCQQIASHPVLDVLRKRKVPQLPQPI